MLVEMKLSWMNQSFPQGFSRLGKDFWLEAHHHNVNNLKRRLVMIYTSYSLWPNWYSSLLTRLLVNVPQYCERLAFKFSNAVFMLSRLLFWSSLKDGTLKIEFISVNAASASTMDCSTVPFRLTPVVVGEVVDVWEVVVVEAVVVWASAVVGRNVVDGQVYIGV